MLPVEEILEALDLSRAQPGLGFLQALFERFNAKVPFENASKIVRDAEVSDLGQKPRRPEIFWTDQLEKGAGGTCFARVAAMDALLRELGFSTRKVLGRVERDFDHAALRVRQGEGEWICDVGFPLPALLPAAPGRIEAILADLEASATPRGLAVEFLAGVPEGPRLVELFAAEVSEEEFADRWRATFAPGARFLSEVWLRRLEATRAMAFAAGEIRVDDRHSRLRVPLPVPRAPRLSELFGVDADLLARALALTGEREAASANGSLTAYLETTAPAPAAFAALANPAGYRRWIEGAAAVTELSETSSGWTVRLAPPQGGAGEGAQGAVFSEEVEVDRERRALRVRRTAASRRFDSELRVEERGGRTFLLREALLDAPREDLLRNDSLRGRLAGTLAVDLLAWTRLLPAQT